MKEGELLDKKWEAQQIAAELRSAIQRGKEEILPCIARVYSTESFLYGLLTASQRNKDITKIDGLGPFAYLLSLYLKCNKDGAERLLYRGATLEDEMIEEYMQAVTRPIVWPSYISTSKDRREAEKFGNTLFIMQTIAEAPKHRSDISKISAYPEEQEVLLDTFILYTVDKIEQDPNTGKYIIYMEAIV